MLAYVDAVKKFINSGGNFLAQCHGIDAYENCDQGQVVISVFVLKHEY